MFELNEEQKIIQKSVHEFAKKELAPKASYWDTHEEFPWDMVRKMAAMGLTGLRLPSLYGGMEADLIATGIALEEVARYDHNCAIILCGSNITGRVLLHGSEMLRQSYLPDIVKGESILAFAAMESEAGSDIRGIKTKAKRVKDAYVITGEKSMITFAEVARGFVVLAKTDEESRE